MLHKGFEPSQELAEELKNHVKNTIAPYKHPQEIEFIAELPKTSSGKILRRELRRLEREKHGIPEPVTKKGITTGES